MCVVVYITIMSSATAIIVITITIRHGAEQSSLERTADERRGRGQMV